MRSNGLTNFPDPKVSVRPGHASVAFRVDPSITGAPKFKSADKTCSKILPGPATPAQQKTEQQAHKRDLLAFAQCARRHGLQGFPDPDATGRLTLQMLAAAGIDIHSRQFLDAGKACVGVTNGAVTLPQIEAAVGGQH